MADNFLEYRQQEYEKRKAEWQRKKKCLPKAKRQIERPEDESL
ncbi:MAG: dehydrogenase [Prevotella sp.]|nr:dehydrogenase [Prevotella sp.]MDD7317686.1 dehydrogenase [Prevotellaceae bacterium]MDY4020467.1 dehydrogenase [Prevotella sp.]